MVPLALGSETGGSVRQPAAFCGVVGVKPTYGRVSRSGLVAFGSSLDQVGPLAGSVEDAAVLLAVLAGPDPEDATSALRPVDDYAAACASGVRGMRIGLPREYFEQGLDARIAAATRDAADPLRLSAAVDGGDHLHPSAAGYKVMAEAVDLGLFTGARPLDCAPP